MLIPKNTSSSQKALFAQSQPLDELIIATYVFSAEISQKPSPLPDKLEQSTLGVIVVPVGCHVRSQLVYPLRKQSYLHLGRTSVALSRLKIADNLCLFLLVQIIPYSRLILLKKISAKL
jgi:hypothetical protein